MSDSLYCHINCSHLNKGFILLIHPLEFSDLHWLLYVTNGKDCFRRCSLNRLFISYCNILVVDNAVWCKIIWIVTCPSWVCFSFVLFHKSELESVYAKSGSSLYDYNLVLFWGCLWRQDNGRKFIFSPPPFVDSFHNEGLFICQRECASGTKFS